MRKIKILLLILLVELTMMGCTKSIILDAPIETIQVNNDVGGILTSLSKEGRESIITGIMNTNDYIDFYFSLDESYLCGITHESNHVVVLNEVNEVIYDQKITAPEKDEFSLYFKGWSNDNKWLWITQQHTFFVDYFSLINLKTGSISHFKQEYDFQADYAFNPNNGYLCFSTIPHFLDIDSREEFQATDHEIPLYLVNIFDDISISRKILDRSNNKAFKPIWIDDYTIEYDSPYTAPDETERLTYSFNQTYIPISNTNIATKQSTFQCVANPFTVNNIILIKLLSEVHLPCTSN